LFKKRKEVQKLNKDYDDDMRRLMELQTRQQTLIKEKEDLEYQREKVNNELEDQAAKVERAVNSMNAKFNNLQSVNATVTETPESKDVALEVEKLKTKYLLNAISILGAEIPDLQPIFEDPLAQDGIKGPSRPQTGVDRTGSAH
jgi:hypothetical protein